MSKNIFRILIIVSIFASFASLFLMSESKPTPVQIKVYYPMKEAEILNIEVRGALHLADGCVRDMNGIDYVCGVTRFEIIK